MKRIAVIVSLLALVTVNAKAMNFRTTGNEVVSINKIAVLAVSDPKLNKWRAAQDANPEVAMPKVKMSKGLGFMTKVMTGFGLGGAKIVRPYQIHPNIVSGRISSYMQLVTTEEDKEIVETFNKCFKEIRVEGVLLGGKLENALLVENGSYEYILCHDFKSERERGQAIYSRIGADAYVVGKVLDINFKTRNPYVTVLFGCFDKEGTYIFGQKYTSSGPLAYFTVKDGLRRSARGFANEIMKRKVM